MAERLVVLFYKIVYRQVFAWRERIKEGEVQAQRVK